MLDYADLFPPPDDLPSDPEIISALGVFDTAPLLQGSWDWRVDGLDLGTQNCPGQDPNSLTVSSVQPVHNDNPNSSLGCHSDLNDALAAVDSLLTGALTAPTAPTLPAWPPLLCLDKQPPEDVTNTARSGPDRYFNVAGNTYRCGADGSIHLHLKITPDSLTVPSYPITPGSAFLIGLLPFLVDDSGRLYSVIDHINPPEPKQVFDNDDAAWMDLVSSAGPTDSFDLSSLFDACSPATSHEDGILNFSSGYVPDVPSPGSIPTLSPALSDSRSDSSFGSNGPYEPLFAGAGSQSVAPSPVPTAPPSLPATLSLNEDELKKVAEINEYVDSLVVKRKRRGSGPSLVKLECLWCDKFKPNRRPTELKEHMYAHHGLALFPCPRPGCTHVSNRKSNRKRHLNECQAGRTSNDGGSSEPQAP
ncbi:hypothetical protein FS749_015721 [Ceratobasidium sp. UAMH 11750]|nr:hypothetical protein FS749_015721 [Ceratobasidium sp. UAMH 11750]